MTSAIETPLGQEMSLDIPFDIRYSVLLFSRMKFDILDAGRLLGEPKIARGRRRLREMIDVMLKEAGSPNVEGNSGLLRKEFTVSLFNPATEPIFPRLGPTVDPIGEIKFTLHLSYEGAAVRRSLDAANPFTDCFSLSNAEWKLLGSYPDLQSELAERFKEVQTHAASVGEHKVAQYRRKMFNEKRPSAADIEGKTSAVVTLTFQESDTAVSELTSTVQSLTLDAGSSQLTAKTQTLTFQDASETLGASEPNDGRASPSPSEDLELNRGLQGGNDWSDAAVSQTKIQLHTSDTQSTEEIREVQIQTHMRPRLRNFFSAKADKVHEVVNGTIAGLLKDGVRMEVGSMNWNRAAKLRDEVYNDVRRTLTYDAVVDLPLLQAANHFLRFTFATYGSLMTNLFSQSIDKLFVDVVRTDSDLKRFATFCSIDLADIRLWSRASLGPALAPFWWRRLLRARLCTVLGRKDGICCYFDQRHSRLQLGFYRSRRRLPFHRDTWLPRGYRDPCGVCGFGLEDRGEVLSDDS